VTIDAHEASPLAHVGLSAGARQVLSVRQQEQLLRAAALATARARDGAALTRYTRRMHLDLTAEERTVGDALTQAPLPYVLVTDATGSETTDGLGAHSRTPPYDVTMTGPWLEVYRLGALVTATGVTDELVNGGGDMIILINSRTDMPLYEEIIAAVRQRHPTFPLGISALSYGPSNLTEGFRLAAKFDAQMVWCETVPDELIEYEEDNGTYTRADVTPLALALDTQARLKPSALHTAGVHMKYTRPLDGKSFEEAMQAALGKVDGINVTGPKTGELADVARIQAARRIAGAFPVGLASGVSVENVGEVIGLIDYAIVGTSLKFPEDPLRTSEARVRELRHKMDTLGGGVQP
jgi:predicted TIM-barrel enzyme